MIIWLASYPKSGNTWVRSFISSLLYTNDGKVSFSKLNKIAQFPARSQFLNFIDDLQNVKEISKAIEEQFQEEMKELKYIC